MLFTKYCRILEVVAVFDSSSAGVVAKRIAFCVLLCYDKKNAGNCVGRCGVSVVKKNERAPGGFVLPVAALTLLAVLLYIAFTQLADPSAHLSRFAPGSFGLGLLAAGLPLGTALLWLQRRSRLLQRRMAQQGGLELKALTELAELDAVTGLLNQVALRKRVNSYLASRGSHACGALLLLDIDRFRYINEQFGHFVGDELLRSVGELLHGNFRTNDLVGRMGGDEFAVFVPDLSDPASLAAKCALLRERCGLLGTQTQVTLSVGAVLFAGPAQYDALYRSADSALLAVKEAGGDSCSICTIREDD